MAFEDILAGILASEQMAVQLFVHNPKTQEFAAVLISAEASVAETVKNVFDKLHQTPQPSPVSAPAPAASAPVTPAPVAAPADTSAAVVLPGIPSGYTPPQPSAPSRIATV